MTVYVSCPGQYTRDKGLDRDHNKELLVTHIKWRGPDGCAISELEQVLPNDTGRYVRRPVAELRAEGRIESTGRGRYAKWIAAPSSSGR